MKLLDRSKTNWKYVIITLAVAFLAGLIVFFYENFSYFPKLPNFLVEKKQIINANDIERITYTFEIGTIMHSEISEIEIQGNSIFLTPPGGGKRMFLRNR